MSDKPPRPTIRHLLQDAQRKIDRLDAEILLGDLLKKDRAWLMTHDDLSPSSAVARTFQALVQRRTRHEPVAYLIHEREFYGRPFFVSKHVLIPRPETELTVERVLKIADNRSVIWDVGTGSGAIGVTLACELPSVRILATDVSSRALTAARQNAKRHHVASRITFLTSNLLQSSAYRWLFRRAKGHHLIITANLPYLPASDKKVLAPDVVKYEPSLALFSGTDGLILIKKFLAQLSRHLPDWKTTQTTILLEFDPPQAAALTKIAQQMFPAARVTVHQDLGGLDRLMEIAI